MIFDHVKNLDCYRGMGKYFDMAFDFILSNPDFASQADDQWRHIDGDNLFYKVTDFEKSIPVDSDYDYEYHKRHADIHLLLNGRERIAMADFSKTAVKDDYNAAADFGFAKGTLKGYMDMEPGEFMVCFPNDAHRPWIGEGAFRKVLFKIKLDR